MWVCGPYRITVERDGRRQWYRVWLGLSLLADNVATPAELERELARHRLKFEQFKPEHPDP